MRPFTRLFSFGVISTLIFPAAGVAQTSPTAEQCLKMTWGYLKSQAYEYSAINTCAYPVAVAMMTGTKKMIQQTVQPGEGLRTGLTLANFEADRKKSGWIATICRADEVASLEVSVGNWDAILKGNYECRKP